MFTNDPTNQTTTVVFWDKELLKNSLKQESDNLIDNMQPHVVNTLKATTGVVFTTSVTSGGNMLKAATLTNSPGISPCVNVAIDSGTVPLVDWSTRTVSPMIDSTVPRTVEIVKQGMHNTIDNSVDFSSRSVSFFSNN